MITCVCACVCVCGSGSGGGDLIGPVPDTAENVIRGPAGADLLSLCLRVGPFAKSMDAVAVQDLATVMGFLPPVSAATAHGCSCLVLIEWFDLT